MYGGGSRGILLIMNYQKELDKILADIQQTGGRKPTLLLHACCAPCSSYVLEYLSEYFDITIYYYNPNIYPKTEYERRLEELVNFLPRFGPAKTHGIQLVTAEYNPEEFFTGTGVLQDTSLQTEPEKGERCRRCYLLRMKKAYEYAAVHAYNWFTTTLSISPFKDAEKIHTIGMELEASFQETVAAEKRGPRFLTSDFKKRGGFKRSLELSAEYGLYRQTYCGCLYSKRSREEFDNAR